MGLFGFGSKEYSDIRSDVAKNCKEGVDPRTALDDWGDFNEDHKDDEKKPERLAPGGAYCPTKEEVDEFYDGIRPEHLKIKR